MQTGAVKSILRILLRQRLRLSLGIACLLLVDGGQLVIPLIIRQVVDRVSTRSASINWLVERALLLVGLALIIAVFRFAWRHFFFSAARLAELALRQRIYQHAQTLSTDHFTATRTGEIMALATNDVESVRQALAMGFVAGFDASIYTVVGVGAIFWLDPQIGVWIVLPLPLLAILMKVSLQAVYQRWDRVQAAFEALTERARESVAGVRIIKAFSREASDAQRFDSASRDYFDRTLHYFRVDALFHPSILLLTGSCMAILLGLGGSRAIAGQLSVGTLVALSSYLGMLTWPMIAAGWMFALLQRSAASMARIEAFLAKKPQADLPGTVALPFDGGRIEARGLNFTYPGASSPALSNLSFVLPARASLGLVGEVGSGKSTLSKLLVRLHDPPEGSVFIDGHDIRRADTSSLRQAISLVPQEAFLFSDTIEANLRIGNPDATLDELKTAAELAALHDEIEGLADGYQTLLGERGITLSGGQKQRLCLARALLKPAPILLLDDTLSAVDAESEQRILRALERVRKARTTLIISHRVSAVRDLDQILVLKAGKVIQQGTPAELLRQPGVYQHMAKLQELLGSE